MIRLRRLLPFALAVALLALPAIAIAGTNAQAGRQIQVNVVDNAFEPKTITVNAGDTVVWTNNGNRNHTVTASDGSWDSGQLAPGQTFSHTFATAGTVPYYCRPHGTPDGQGMAATVMVQAAAGAGQPAQQTPQALPSTGEASPSSLWMAPLIVAVALLLGGTLLLAANAANRR